MNTVDYHITVSFSICTCRIHLTLLSICISSADIINVITLVMSPGNSCEIIITYESIKIISAEETSLNYYSIN